MLMRNFKQAIIVLAIIIISSAIMVFLMYSTEKTIVNITYSGTRFEIIDKQINIDESFYTIKDTKTGVYYIAESRGGIYPLYNKDGTLYTEEGE